MKAEQEKVYGGTLRIDRSSCMLRALEREPATYCRWRPQALDAAGEVVEAKSQSHDVAMVMAISNAVVELDLAAITLWKEGF